MEKRATLVLDINELYNVIPECKVLEGKNFKDVRELLKKLITAVEESGEWEFIQHVQNKPSLFIVRNVVPVVAAEPEVTKTQLIKLEERVNTLGSLLTKVDLVGKGVSKQDIATVVEEVKEHVVTSIYDNPIFKDDAPSAASESTVKLPWQQ